MQQEAWAPAYPPADWVSAVEGDIVVRAAISETGHVTGVEILKGLTAGLDKAAVEALKRCVSGPRRVRARPLPRTRS